MRKVFLTLYVLFAIAVQLFVLDMGDGDWHMKDEIDNSSEALRLY